MTIQGDELASLLLRSEQNPDDLVALNLPKQLSFGVLLVEKEPLVPILAPNQASYKDLVGEPDTAGLFASGTSVDRVEETRAAAGGDDVNLQP